MCNFIKKHFVKLLLLLVITACESNQHPVPRCIPADALSEAKTASVSAYFNESSEDFIADDKSLGNVLKNDQVVRWKYTGYVTDGNPIVLRVDGMWTAWADNASESDRSVVDYEKYDSILSSERICGPYNKIQKTFVPYGQNECKVSCELIVGVQDELERGAYGPPCWFKNGYGAYLLFKRPDDPEPNETLNHMRYPVSPVMHIGYKPLELAGSDALSTRDRKIMDSLCQEVKLEPGWKIYLKILDKHYYDNVGGYSVTFVEGIKQEEQFSVFEWVRKNIRNELDKAGEHVFKHVVGNPVFKNFVFALLTLFLIFGALSYIFGMVQSPFSDVIIRILKMALMILLISPSSWEFFYNHLLNLFINGIDQIIAMINSHSASYNPTRPFAFLDEMIVDKIFSPVIWKVKIRALILADFSSIFAVLVIIIAVLIYVALCLYGCVIYLTAFVGITFLIGLFPLLLLGILFSQFKSLFDGWLTQCLSFSMQAILMFTLISLFGALIMNYYYRIFGFTTCYNEWLKVKVCILGSTGCVIDRSVFGWTPGQIYDPKVIGLTTDFNLNDRKTSGNARYKFTGGGAYISVPPERIHKDFRYVDYPFLDPDSQTDGDPFGITVSKDSPFRQLSYYINALLASNEKYVAARLIKDIEDELEKLKKDGTITSDSENKVLTIIKNRRNADQSQQKNALDKYQDEDFKSEIINSLINDVIGEAAQTPTPQDELIKQHDYNLILGIKAGHLILWSEVGSLFLAALLIWQMRAFIQSVAVALAGGSMMSQTIANMYEGGFLKIFSGIPVLGVVFKKIDQGIDSLKFVTGNYITKTARRPLEALKRVPYLGNVVKFTSAATAPLTSSYNEYDRDFRNNFKTLNYARAFIGAHLGVSPLDAMKYLGGHVAGSMFGTREGGLIHNILEDREAALDSLKAHILGPEQYKPSPYIPNAGEEDDDRNPFAKEKPHADKETSPGNGDNRLLDENGNISINKDNLSDALDAREQLKTMIENTTDEGALQKIRYDLDRLDDALHKNLGSDFDKVTTAYANSHTPIEHPKDLLGEGMSGFNVSSENLQGLGVPKVDEVVQADSNLSVPLNSDIISSSTHLDVTPTVSDADSLLSQQVGVEGVHDSVLRDNAGLTTPLDVTSPMDSVDSEVSRDSAAAAFNEFTNTTEHDAGFETVELQTLSPPSDGSSVIEDTQSGIIQQHSVVDDALGSTSSMEGVGTEGDTAARAPVEVFEDSAGSAIESQDFGSAPDDTLGVEHSDIMQQSGDVDDTLSSASSMEDVGTESDSSSTTAGMFDEPTVALEEGNTMFSQAEHSGQNIEGLGEETGLHAGIVKQNEVDESESAVKADTTFPEDNIVQETDSSVESGVGVNVFEQADVFDIGSLESDVSAVGDEGIFKQQAAESLLDDVPNPETSDDTVSEKVAEMESVFEKADIQETDPHSITMEQAADENIQVEYNVAGDTDAEKLLTEDLTKYAKVDASVSEETRGDLFVSEDEGKLSEVPKDGLVTQQEDKFEDVVPDDSMSDAADSTAADGEKMSPEGFVTSEEIDTSDVQGEGKQDQDVVDKVVEKTGDVSDQSDTKGESEVGVPESESLAEGLINLVSTGEGLHQDQSIQIVQPVAGLSNKDKGVVAQDKVSDKKGAIGGQGVSSAQSDVKVENKEKKKESSKSKAKSPSKTKSPFVTPKSLKNTFSFVLHECAKDFSSKVLESVDKLFGESQGGKQKRRLSKEEISLAIEQLKSVIESLKAKKANLTDHREIESIELRIKEAETAMRGLLDQE